MSHKTDMICATAPIVQFLSDKFKQLLSYQVHCRQMRYYRTLSPMAKMQSVTVSFPSGKQASLPYGTQVQEVLKEEEFQDFDYPIVGALVNNETVSLSFKIEVNAKFAPIALNSVEGSRIYRQSLCFLLTIASQELFPERRLVIGHSLGDSYYYYYEGYDGITDNDLTELAGLMQKLVDENLTVRRRVLSYCDALEFLKENNQMAAVQLLEHRSASKIPVYECRGFRDISHGPLISPTGLLTHFELKQYHPGFLLRYPPVEKPTIIEPFIDHPVVFSIFKEYKRWGQVLEVSSAGQLDALIRNGQIQDFVQVAEALHNKKIAEIANRIEEKEEVVKLILIAGPSSSGKTTFTKKLAIQLRVVGYKPIVLSTDDYFLPRELSPKNKDGEYDFESIAAIDTGQLNNNLTDLLQKKEVQIPEYRFKEGNRRPGKVLQLERRSILIIEGIHGLNDRLTHLVPQEDKFKIYISALTQLNIDDHNRIPTTDVRLLRRMVRDHQFRGYSALETLARWPSVRAGENRNIFPFEGNADVAFNSSLDYEIPVLKGYAEPLLRTVKPFHEEYAEARRLSSFLGNFILIPSNHVPHFSILREFIGESGFRY